jgi:F-type H+-transporting ATPase subunit gamma
MHTMERGELLRSLAHEYLFISVYRSVAESQAAENTARLASMQGAERNIEDRITELTADYNRTRQMTITEELLDIVSGFEALKEDDDEEAA